MKLLFVHSHIFKYDHYGNFYSDGKLTYQMWKNRYLISFKELIVAGRGQKVHRTDNLNKSSGSRVSHVILPNLSTLRGRYKNVKKLKTKLFELIKSTDLLVARMPSTHAYHAIKIAKKLKKPYVVEVVGDGFTSLWTHGSIFGKVLAPIIYIRNRKIIKDSSYLIYVTKYHLQKRYPHNSGALSINASNVDIEKTDKSVLLKRKTKIKNMKNNELIKIGLIGSYSSKYKGIDTAIKSIKTLKEKGFNCQLFVLGNGNNKWLIKLAKKLGIENNIIFTGTLPGGQEVFKWLDALDVYIQPSLTEGLPRALIEAMSRGLPCVGSSVGGIPELLEKKFIHSPKSSKETNQIIEYLLLNPTLMLEQAEKNFCQAKEYNSSVLNNRRKEFWSQVINKEFKK